MSESTGRHALPDKTGVDEPQAIEVNAIEHVAERLQSEFPETPPDKVEEIVASHYHELDDKPIREFVPVLVEHAAKAELIDEQREGE